MVKNTQKYQASVSSKTIIEKRDETSADKKRWGQTVTEQCLGMLEIPVRGTEATASLETTGKRKSYLEILNQSKPFLNRDCTNTGKLGADRERSGCSRKVHRN